MDLTNNLQTLDNDELLLVSGGESIFYTTGHFIGATIHMAWYKISAAYGYAETWALDAIS
jgi:hypothetical protein